MKLPRALATQAARGSGLVRADPRALTDTGPAGQGAIALGKALGGASDDLFKIQQHKQKISDDTQTDRIGQNIRLWSGAQEEALKTTRIETPQDQEKYLAGFTKGYNEMVKLELKGMSNGVQRNVKSASSRHFPAVHDQARRTSSAKFMEYTTTTELGIANAEAAAGDIEAADRRIDALLQKGIIGPKRAAAAKAVNAEAAKEGLEGDVIDIGLAVWQGTVTPENPDGDLQAAFDVVQKSDVLSQDKQEVESELKTRIANRRAEAKLKLEADREQSRGGINDAIFNDRDYDEANRLINLSPLDESEQTTWLKLSSQRATAAARGVPLKNDRVEENRLYEKALKIWTGSVTKREFDQDLVQNASKLDDDAYNRVTSTAATTLKTSQSQDLSRANTEAMRQLVDFQSEDAAKQFLSDAIKGLEPNVAKLFEQNFNKNRAKQFRELSNLNAELREWIEENPDKTGKEFFQFSRGLENQYKLAKETDTTVEQIRNAEIIKELQSLPQLKTIIMISPDGKEFNVPLDKIQKFTDNGFTGQ